MIGNDVARCMGKPTIKDQCERCARMPQSPEEEFARWWLEIDNKVSEIPCSMFLAKK